MTKGEVRRLADIFPIDEAERASKHLEEALQSHNQTLRTLHGYLNDNKELYKLVQDLPGKVSHNIMVPFGKAAFFPGRLVHTNEFLVLLGESYYAECSAKQTLEILDRRSKFLKTQIAGIDSQIEDLQAESRFFSDTLAEAAAGVVEIREDYASPSNLSEVSEADYKEPKGISNPVVMGTIEEVVDEDREHQRIMARLSELEAAEAAAEGDASDEDASNSNRIPGDTDWLNTSQKTVLADGELSSLIKDDSLDGTGKNESSNECPVIRSPSDLVKFEEWRRHNLEKESARQTSKLETSLLPENLKKEEWKEATRKPSGPAPSLEKDVQKHSDISTAKKAFTGAVLERTGPTLPANNSQGSKQAQTRPTSRFKMRHMER